MNLPTGGGGFSLASLPRDSAVPLYQQIKDAIQRKIRSGEWAEGERIPSENALVDELGVSRMTIHRALRELTQQGYLQRVHGIGTFVAAPPRHASLIEIQNIADEIRAQGHTHRAQIQLREEAGATPEIARQMDVAPGTPLFHVVLLHFRNEVPIQREERWVNPRLAPEFLDTDFAAITPTQYLVNLFRPDEMEHIVSAVMPDVSLQASLAIPASEPCLRLSRRTWVGEAVVTCVNFIYPSTRYDLGAKYSTRA